MSRCRPGAGLSKGDPSPPAWLEGATEEQQRAISYDGERLLVVAGAGTGKTRTLASRVASLIAGGVEPEGILLLTFSRRAAREMLGRAGSFIGGTALGGGGARRVVGGTFHSVAHRYLRRLAPLVGLPTSFSLIDRQDAAELMGVARGGRTERANGHRRFPQRETLLDIYSRLVNTQQHLSILLPESFPWCADERDEIAAIFDRYLAAKRQRHLLDYDDLLVAFEALLASPAGRETIGQGLSHVLVDEYQDVNQLQVSILVSLSQGGARITAVGDDAQAIYGFRGSSPDAMSGFENDFLGAEVITLEESFRSTPEILDVANAVISQASGLREKCLWSQRRRGGRPQVVTCLDEAAQASAVADKVLEHRECGIGLREQAVLFRTGHHSDGLEVELSRRNIPFIKYGGLRFLEAAHVKDLLAVMRILDNPIDDLAWRRVLGLLEGMGPVRIERLLARIGVTNRSATFETLIALGDHCSELPTSARDDFTEIARAMRLCAESRPALSPGAEIDLFRPFFESAFDRKYPSAPSRLSDIDHLASSADGSGSRAQFLADITLDPPASTSDLAGPPHLDDDFLTLSTIHSAKGGEWRVVHLIHAADGCIPSDMATSSPAEIEEERRLMYVALTRARDHLHITFPLRFYHERTRLQDPHSYAVPSRFLNPAFDLIESTTAGFGDPSVQVGDGAVESGAGALDPRERVASLWA